MRSTFDTVIEWVLVHEGGYSSDRNDPGNWTGGKVGKGQLKGTKYGISARAYPNLDIKGLTRDSAKVIYKRDYWDKSRCDDLPAGVDYAVFDGNVNSGNAQSAKWLQRAVGAAVDGIIGNATVDAVDKAATRNEEALIASLTEQRLKFLRNLSTWSRYGTGWSRRVAEVNANAIKLARADSKFVMPSHTTGTAAKARAEDTRMLTMSDGKAAVGAGIGAVGVAASQIADQIAPYSSGTPILRYVFVALTCVGIGIGAYQAIKGLMKKEVAA